MGFITSSRLLARSIWPSSLPSLISQSAEREQVHWEFGFKSRNEELTGKCKLLLEENAYLKKSKESISEQLNDAHELITVLQNDAREKESKISELYEKLEAKELYIQEANEKNGKLVKLLDQEIEKKTEKMRSQSQKGRRTEEDGFDSSGKKSLNWRRDSFHRSELQEEEFNDSYQHPVSTKLSQEAEWRKRNSPLNQPYHSTGPKNHSARKLLSVLESYKDSPSKRTSGATKTPQMRGQSPSISRNTMDNIYSVNSKKKMLEEKLRMLNKI